MKKTFIIFLFLIFKSVLFAQQISNIQTRFTGNNVVVDYTLNTQQPTDIKLFYSSDKGNTYQPCISISGDVNGQSSGNKKIVWDCIEDGVIFANVVFKLNFSTSNALSEGRWRSLMLSSVKGNSFAYADGSSYKGEHAGGLTNGLGACYFSDGSFYLGNNRNGYYHGSGIYIMPKGQDILNCKNCRYYVGNWISGIKSGKGNCYDNKGNLIYSGSFLKGAPAGTYPLTSANTAYKFECVDYSNGDKYVGETKAGLPSGYGTYLWTNGDLWYGRWENGKQTTEGILIYFDGYLEK